MLQHLQTKNCFFFPNKIFLPVCFCSAPNFVWWSAVVAARAHLGMVPRLIGGQQTEAMALGLPVEATHRVLHLTKIPSDVR